jgi:Protein of unknown function (DUF2721)
MVSTKVDPALRLGDMSHITDITQTIQLAVAPVFLLTAVATLITVLNVRLGRNIDRTRVVQDRLGNLGDDLLADRKAWAELRMLTRRARLIYFAIFSAALSALLVCLVVAGAFLGALLSVDLAKGIASLFVFAIVALIAGLGMFLREVFLAVMGGSHVIEGRDPGIRRAHPASVRGEIS